MKISQGIRTLTNPQKKGVMTLGNFDGVHLGHQELIKKMVHIAQKENRQSIVFTFSPHPSQVLNPHNCFKRIFTEEDQQTQLEKRGVSLLNVEPFVLDLAQKSAEDFFHEYIWEPFEPSTLVVGYDFAFGCGKEGNIDLLKKLCLKKEITLEVVDAYKKEGQIVSSTLIKNLILSGEVQRAAHCLGRFFYLEGEVVKGEQRGKKIGFPTANLLPSSERQSERQSELQLGKGVYVTSVQVFDRSSRAKKYKAVTNVGEKPTFKKAQKTAQKTEPQISIETHLIDFDEDIYFKKIRIEFLFFLRDERKFSDTQSLVSQIQKDVAKARSTALA